MSKLEYLLCEMTTLIKLRLKIIFRDKFSVGICLFSLIIITFILGTLSINAVERSKIPIGVVDLDNTDSSRNMLRRLKDNSSLYLYTKGEKELNRMMKEEQLDSVFVIEKGFEKKIQNGDDQKLISMYYLKNKQENRILSDIVAGDFLYNVTLWNGFRKYLSYSEHEKFTPKSMAEYMDYAKGIDESTEYNFSFDVKFLNTVNNRQVKNEWNNEIIYDRIIFIILSMLIAFIQIFFVTSLITEKERGITKRIELLSFTKRIVSISNYLALTILNIALSILFTFILVMNIKALVAKDFINVFIIMLLYSCLMSGIFMLLCRGLSKISTLQFCGTIYILLSGVVDFLRLLEGNLPSKILNISKIIPNCLFNQGLTDIIIKGNIVNNVQSREILAMWILFIIMMLLLPSIKIISLLKVRKA